MTQSAERTPEGDYLAKPSPTISRGVLVLHAWWGLTPFVQTLCDRLAQAGFVALAPDFFQGRTATTIQEAEQLSSEFETTPASIMGLMQVALGGARRLLAACGPGAQIGALGFSFGGFYTLWLAAQPYTSLRAAVVFYAPWGSADYSSSRAAFQFHLAETDPYTPAPDLEATQKALQAAGREAEFHSYPGTGHWFFESNQPAAYDPAAAELAWSRMLQFLNRCLPQAATTS